VIVLFHFDETAGEVAVPWPLGSWVKRLDSAEEGWAGPGSCIPSMIRGGSAAALKLEAHSFAFFLDRMEP
jgi:hypothetical protein